VRVGGRRRGRFSSNGKTASDAVEEITGNRAGTYTTAAQGAGFKRLENY